MALLLCNDEKVLKSWTFACDDTSAGKKHYNLTVTDKRLISTTSTPNSISRTELPLNSIKSISGSYSKNSNVLANPKKGLIIFGILLLIAGLILIFSFMQVIAVIVVGAIMMLSGFIMAVYGGSKSTTVTTHAGFKLNITTYGSETSSMAIGKQFTSNEAQTQTISVTHVTINELAVYEIIDMLGALIIGKRELNTPPHEKATDGLYDTVTTSNNEKPLPTKGN